MLKLIFLLTSIFIVVQHYSQHLNCGTESTVDPNFNTTDFRQFMANSSGSKSILNIPVKVHIVRTNSGYGGISTDVLREGLEVLNSDFDSIGLRFFLCDGIDYIDNSYLYDLYGPVEAQYIYIYNQHDAINVYFFNSVVSPSGTNACGYAFYPWSGSSFTHYIAMSKNCVLNSRTLSHEFGHFFGLYHTHDTVNGVELVDSSNCSIAGDLCCDTPADPQLSYSLVNSSCNYVGTYTDPNGTPYTPDPQNIMSYSRHGCRNKFTAMQYSRMQYYHVNYRNNFDCLFYEDLSIRDVSVDRVTLEKGGSLFLSFTEQYLGHKFSADREMENIEIYISKDTIIDSQDIVVQTISSSTGIDNSVNTELTEISMPNSINTGNYYLIAAVDYQNEIVESDENNNSLFVGISVVDFVHENVTIFPNPASEILNYAFVEDIYSSLEIYNNLGQLLIIESEITGSVSLTKIPAGSYFIKFKSILEKNNAIIHFVKQ